jgi:NAD+ synthase
MEYKNGEQELTNRQKEVLAIYTRFHATNKHKMSSIPVCKIPENLK